MRIPSTRINRLPGWPAEELLIFVPLDGRDFHYRGQARRPDRRPDRSGRCRFGAVSGKRMLRLPLPGRGAEDRSEPAGHLRHDRRARGRP